jgi:23S rRNA pseudouridine1911/1915/1917 synthase
VISPDDFPEIDLPDEDLPDAEDPESSLESSAEDEIVEPTTESELVELVVDEESVGVRVDKFIVSQRSDLSRTHIQALMDQGRVFVDGLAVKPSTRVVAGQSVSIEIPPPPAPGVTPEAIPIEVLYEDADLAVINKPSGMIVHPGAGVRLGTLVAALLYRFGEKSLSTIGAPLRPGIVHRLDKDTSGAIVIARTDAAHKKLVEQFQARQVDKTYVALLHGALKGESGTIDLPISRDLRRRSRMTARRREGREARTDWKVCLRARVFTLVKANIHTGRTHQIRVHFSALACPVVGDVLYGAPHQERIESQLLPPLGRNFLHAARLVFAHPRTRKIIDTRAPLPPELVDYFRTLGRATHTDPG